MLVNNCREAVAGQLQQVLANLYSRLGEIGHYMFLYCVSGRGGDTVCLAAMLNKDFSESKTPFWQLHNRQGQTIYLGSNQLAFLACLFLINEMFILCHLKFRDSNCALDSKTDLNVLNDFFIFAIVLQVSLPKPNLVPRK